MSSTKSPVLKLVEEIIAADPGVRFASIIDKNFSANLCEIWHESFTAQNHSETINGRAPSIMAAISVEECCCHTMSASIVDDAEQSHQLL